MKLGRSVKITVENGLDDTFISRVIRVNNGEKLFYSPLCSTWQKALLYSEEFCGEKKYSVKSIDSSKLRIN